MKRSFLAISLLLLSGCVTTAVPVKRNFPEAPAALLKKCEELKTIDNKEKVLITDMLKVVVQNYTLYYECSIKVDGWNEWYTSQKEIFNKVQ